jgi:hypothetical protein
VPCGLISRRFQFVARDPGSPGRLNGWPNDPAIPAGRPGTGDLRLASIGLGGLQLILALAGGSPGSQFGLVRLEAGSMSDGRHEVSVRFQLVTDCTEPEPLAHFGQLRWAMWLIRRRVGSPAGITTGATLGCRKAMRDPEGTAFDIN